MIAALVGAQFGSEGKGLIAGHIAMNYGLHVRVGAANAGHTVYSLGDTLEKHVMQQIPCAAYTNPEADLAIGPGALISPDIFLAELSNWNAWRDKYGYAPRPIFVDPRAHVIQQDQIDREQQTDLAERIGSTSTIAREGIGIAAADRVLRTADCLTADRWVKSLGLDVLGLVALVDVPKLIHHRDKNGDVLLEGTQGTGLSNTTGFFPYTTSRNTTAAGLAADCGAAPGRVRHVIAVARTYPIRVAGNSGPFYQDSNEISWDKLGIDPENERTTVTKKIRRVATFSYEQVRDAVRINGASEVALTFADYLDDQQIAGASGLLEPGDAELDGHEHLMDMLSIIESTTGVPVKYIGTGPYTVIERLPFELRQVA
jgi:adenylosuccinate synthase